MQKTIVTVLVTAVVFALGGWFAASKTGKVTLLSHAHMYKDCRGKDCDVTIQFACVDATNPTTCEPYPVEELILVNPKYKIRFAIDPTTNFAFDSTDGIKFTSANADGYLPCTYKSKQKYECDNNIPSGTASDAYKYQIHVQGMTIVDPWIVNY